MLKTSSQSILFIGSLLIWGIVTVLVSSQIQPDTTVITHISITGKATTSKSVADLYWLLGISLAIISGTFFMSLYPEKMNYPFMVTDENRKHSYQKMRLFLGMICLATTTVFMSIALKSVNLLQINNVTIVLTSMVFFSAVLPMIMVFVFKPSYR